jgi:uncharacterized protein YqjF (DUF2071 family)
MRMTSDQLEHAINKHPSQVRRVFLSAEWRDLVMLNYEVEPSLLNRFVPRGTALDSYQGRTYISLVGFRFYHTKLFGYLPIPLHADFDEVNLRFYVRRKEASEDRRGVVFIAEVVPRRAIAAIARLAYGENYVRLPMRRQIEANESGRKADYQWKIGGQWCRLSAQTNGISKHPQEGSLEQFITEHYWGYSARRDGESLEYHVSHPPWEVWTASTAGFEGDASALYGRELATVLQRRPDCAFVAAGSPVIVFKGNKV